MFEDDIRRFITDKVYKEISLEVIEHLWWMIDERRKAGAELDYLQVFKLKADEGRQAIIHQQVQPSYFEQSLISLLEDQPLTNTLWCVDTGEFQVLLFPEEYK